MASHAEKAQRAACWLLAFAGALGGCEPPGDEPSKAGARSETTASSAPVGAAPLPPAGPSPPPSGPRPIAQEPPACPEDMALVVGNYCPVVQQICLEEPRILGTNTFGHCKRYAPARCLAKERQPLRFCMDRFEWPNRRGEKPRTLVSWPEAQAFCQSVGKRLCTEHEFNFACEGEQMLAHVYGNERDDTKCHFDRPYRQRTFNYQPWDACMANLACKEEYDRLDQRLPAGSMPDCVSADGIFDLNGNANEWVHRTDQRPPRRSGLKGGWWGPVRNRCRPMTTFHLEGDYGYEAGFRCCKDPS
jgi:formylglycine-generating enzyme